MYRKWYQVNPDVSILDFKDLTFCDVTDDLINKDSQNLTETYTARHK